ncbi:hypothetical protein EJB05_57421, partial [Eragrostis curvula]
EDEEAEAALAGEDAADGGACCTDPAADLCLQHAPPKLLDVIEAELLYAEAAQGQLDGRLANRGVGLDALAAIAGCGHAGGDGVEVTDGIRREEEEDDTEESSSSPASDDTSCGGWSGGQPAPRARGRAARGGTDASSPARFRRRRPSPGMRSFSRMLRWEL